MNKMKTMKKTTIFKAGIFTAAAAITLSSCEKYLDDVRPNPNDPETATLSSLLGNIEVATYSNFSGQNARRAAIFTQHMAGTDGQMQIVAQYNVTEGDVTNEWKTLYSNAMINASILIEQAGDENPYYRGIAKILMAMNLGLATDQWGDVPYSDAFKGLSANFTPQYDSQQSVIASIQSLLSEAITDLARPSTSNLFFPGATDYTFGGDVAQWTKTAWVLKARYANRLSDINPSQSATDALNFLAQAGMTSNTDDANCVFGPNGNENNQWAVFNQTRADYIHMGEFFVELMKTNSDPRLPFYCTQDDTSGYSGTAANDLSNTSTSNLGSFYGSVTSIAPLVTYVEAKFIEAEANLRLGNGAAAATAHNDAVKASMLAITGAQQTAYETANASETAGTITLQKIMTEKYVALFTQIETWADWRRTGFPALTPNNNAVLGGIPRRLPTPTEERQYNPNAIVVGNILNHVWWDQ